MSKKNKTAITIEFQNSQYLSIKIDEYVVISNHITTRMNTQTQTQTVNLN